MIEPKEEIIRKAAKNLELPIETVEKVFSFQFKDVVEQTKHCNSIEINGLCRLLVMPKKVENRINVLTLAIFKYNEKLKTANEAKSITLNKQIETALEQIQVLTQKLNR